MSPRIPRDPSRPAMHRPRNQPMLRSDLHRTRNLHRDPLPYRLPTSRATTDPNGLSTCRGTSGSPTSTPTGLP